MDAHSVNEAVTQLFEQAPPQDFERVLDEFWECWLTHEQTDLVPANERGEMLFYYKNLLNFFKTFENDG